MSTDASIPTIAGQGQAPAPHEDAHHVPSLRTYLIVFAALMVMLVITVGAAFIPFPGLLNILIAMIIASVKAGLVIWYFMHVKDAGRLTKAFVVGSFLWLGILFSYTFADYLSRSWLPMSKGWTENPAIGADPGIERIPYEPAGAKN